MSTQCLQCLLPGANLLRLERYEIDEENLLSDNTVVYKIGDHYRGMPYRHY